MTTQQDPFQPWKDAVAERDRIIQRWTNRAQYLEERVGILEDYLAQIGIQEFPGRNPDLRRVLREKRQSVPATPAPTSSGGPPPAPAAPTDDEGKAGEGE